MIIMIKGTTHEEVSRIIDKGLAESGFVLVIPLTGLCFVMSDMEMAMNQLVSIAKGYSNQSGRHTEISLGVDEEKRACIGFDFTREPAVAVLYGVEEKDFMNWSADEPGLFDVPKETLQ